MFFSLLVLLSFAHADVLNLGPHLRIDKKSFYDLKLSGNKVVFLITPHCSYCKVQMTKLDCLNSNDVFVLVDKSDGRGLSKLKIPPSIPTFLTTRRSLEQFHDDIVYPMGFIKISNKIIHFKGVQECELLFSTKTDTSM